ncbi:MAG: clostripain-related cysteine peptidase [candidate division WOR-3 bacterium]
MAIRQAGGWLTIPLLLLLCPVYGAQWTVGIYMCADNGMSEQAYEDLREMLTIGSTSEVNIIVQVDNAARDTNPGCRRYYVRKSVLDLLADLGEVDMADTAVLADFIEFLGTRYPASNYLLILWDHGNGWRAGYGPQRAVFIDESHGHMMGVAGGELRKAIKNGVEQLGRKLTIIGFDACLMGSVEIAAELMPFADYLLASEAVVEWDGFPYDLFLGRLTARPNSTPEEFLPEFCTDYISSFPGENVCLSALDLRQFERVLKILGPALQDSLNPQATGYRLARTGVQTFPTDAVRPPSVRDEQIDFIHFWELAPGTGLKYLRSTLNPLVVANATGGSLGNAKGAAVWFPFGYLDFKTKISEYRRLTFADSIPWLKFLNSYFGCDDVKPEAPEITRHRTGGRGDIRLWWRKSWDLASLTYELYQVTEPEIILLDHGDSLNNWESDGWSLSTRYFRSPARAFFSGSASNLNCRLELKDPLHLPQGGLLSFYGFYSTQETEDSTGNIRRDVCYVEWSSDRTTWQPLDSIYGDGEKWQEFRYLLPATPQLYLRFRYQTDAEINRLGVFIDDIRIERFARLRRALTTSDTTAYLFNLARDTSGYYFLVIAIDSFGNRSRVSQYYSVRITSWAEPYTLPAPFTGPCRLILDFPPEEIPDVFIYTLSGTLVKKFSRVQNREIQWSGTNEQNREVADGVYIVVVQGKNFRKTGRIAKVRLH